MTNTSLRATVRRRLDQTDNTDTQFSDAMIDELGNQARRMFAAILPEEILTSLVAGTSSSLTVTAGIATYPADFLRKLENKEVLIDSVHAKPIGPDETWRLKFLESNDNVKSGAADKYYRELVGGIKVYPTSASALVYPYIRKPDDLDGSANADMPLDVDDMVVDYVFEKCMGTQRGDLELAALLARNRGYLFNAVVGTA